MAPRNAPHGGLSWNYTMQSFVSEGLWPRIIRARAQNQYILRCATSMRHSIVHCVPDTVKPYSLPRLESKI